MAVGILSGRQVAQERPEDPLDKIAKGLNIAQSVFGIATNIDTLAKNKQLRDYAEKEALAKEAMIPVEQEKSKLEQTLKQQQVKGFEQEQAGILTPQKAAGAGILVPRGTKGSVDIGLTTGQEFGLIPRAVTEAEANAQMKQLQIALASQNLKKGAEPKQEEKQANIFYNRMTSAEEVVNSLPQDQLTSVYRNLDPLTPESAKSPTVKKYEQAIKNFSSAILRKESGAAISKSEFDQVRQQYFPSPGDDPQTLQNKAEARAQAIQGMKEQAGPALKALAPKKEKAPAVDMNQILLEEIQKIKKGK